MFRLFFAIGCILLALLIFYFGTNQTPSSFSEKIVDNLEGEDCPILDKADVLRWEQKYPAAILNYKNILNASEGLSPSLKTYVLNQLVACYLYTHRYSEAKDCLDQIEEATLNGFLLADFKLNKGRFLKATGDGLAAIPYIEAADSIYQHIYNPFHLKHLLCLTELADLYYHYADERNILEITFQYLNKADKILLKAPELKPYAKAYFYLKGYYAYIERTYQAGINNLNVAIEEASKAPFKDTMFIARCLSQKGRMYKGIGDSVQAVEHSLKAIELGETQQNAGIGLQQIYREHLTLCNKYKQKSGFWHYLEKLQTVQQQQKGAKINTTRLLAIYYYRTKNTKKAIQYFRNTLAQLDNGTIKYNQAKLYDESLFALASMYEHTDFDSVFYFLARNISTDRVYTPASLEELLAPEMKTSDVHNFFNYAKLANAYATISPETALKVYTSADSLFFNYSLMANNEAALNFLAEIAAYYYPKAADIAFELFQKTGDNIYLSQANLFLERVKAFSLFRDMETFEEEEEAYLCSNQQLIQQQKNLKQQLEELRWKQLKSASSTVDRNLQKVLLELPELSEQIEQQCPNYHSYKLQKNSLSPFEDIKQYAANNAVSVLQYAINGNRVTGFLIQKDTVLVHTLEQFSFSNNLQQYRSSLTKRIEVKKAADYLRSAHELYKALIAPFYPLIPRSNTVLIIPDAQLSNIPFDALLTEAVSADKPNFKALPYLIKDWNIAYTFSVKTFLLNMQRKPALQQPSKILTFSYSSDNSFQNPSEAERHSEIESGFSLIKHLEDNYPSLKHDTFSGERATAERFFEQAKQDFDIIQLSLHAEADSLHYLNNSLFFRKLDKNKQLSEKSVHGFEIKKMQIQAPLVVLAACETAEGQTQLGDGRFSLSRTFLEAGARTVLSTLWVTKDFTMKKMLPTFYDSLLVQPENISAALRKAKLQYIEEVSNPLASPAYWSGFICLN